MIERVDSESRAHERSARASARIEAQADAFVFVALWASGSDPQADALLCLDALRVPLEGRECTRFATRCAPRESESEGARRPLSARCLRDFGLSAADLEGAPRARQALEQLARFAGRAAFVVLDRAAGSAWTAALAPELARCPVVDLAGLAALTAPGQLPAGGHALAALLAPAPPAHALAFAAEHVRGAADALLARFAALPEEARCLAARGYAGALSRARRLAPEALPELALTLAWLDRPSLCARHVALADGWLGAAAAAPSSLEALLARCTPPWTEEWLALRRAEPVPADSEEPRHLDELDLALIDRVFESELPRRFGSAQAPGAYRGPQHELARVVARSLGRKQAWLLHAPTGTGKTLAYLVPALLWALRANVRVGVCTFTRALQEQAMLREVPVALAALEACGAGGTPRVAVLKGRANYLCWRALGAQAPEAGDGPGYWLAWTELALFACQDREGDLDRMPLRAALPGLRELKAEQELGALVGSVRAETACCSDKHERDRCAAEVARRRAERAHLVIANHAFALVRREFFRHVIFDECEHLHDQARSAFSHELHCRELRELLWRLEKPGQPDRSALLRIERATAEGEPAFECAQGARAAHRAAIEALAALEQCLADFRGWREEALRTREERDAHSLLREYAISADGAPLLDAHAALVEGLDELGARLAQLSEHVDLLELRGAARLRRNFDRVRGELEDLLSAVLSWLPRQDGAPCFAPENFYDAEFDARGESVLVVRVLLPHEYLGRHYYPDLSSLACLSATTWMRGGFEAAANYLGLWRAAHPAEDETREPLELCTHRSQEIFDYERVLVLAPRDAPLPAAQGGAQHTEFVRRFVAHLGERTRGRMLVLFTNAEQCLAVGRRLAPFFAERGIPFWYQRMPGMGKEELAELFRAQPDSVLMGLDTFWFGADFPGETLEYLVIARLPYGVPDRYHYAQCAAIGADQQRRSIYLPKALAKFRQGFGRLMRRESDRGCVFVLDARATEPRHRVFLAELPLAGVQPGGERLARLVRAETDVCVREALVHMGMLADVQRRGLDQPFRQTRLGFDTWDEGGAAPAAGDMPF